ncbi:lysylphosphatidylglycerol synthase transmembrane domain-containing protein [Salinisphaera aquimarina]|uniref:Lysylphosphatidylglycerol synthase transmembrane domain-containing protein n=1 Tax=Salinisphaera aquimarina TaxID=2094031 RepID=A0ABV7EPB4_9GAMM
MTKGVRWVLRSGITLALFALLYWRLDLEQLTQAFDTVRPGWLVAALALTLPQVVISAWRWQLTARQIGLALPLSTAVREYYLATFLNQVLPGGVIGDASRAWRHGGSRANAWHAVVIERVSGQLSLGLVALIALGCAPALRDGVVARLAVPHGTALGLICMAALAVLVTLLVAVRHHAGVAAAVVPFLRNIGITLLGSRTWPAQLISSLLVVASYIGVFLLAALAIDLDTPISQLWVLIPPVLMAMAIPLSIAGWGIREGAAALIWMLAGLPAHEGVALSLAYGLIVLASSLPGALMLWPRRVNLRAAGTA